jgi:hypothetical protein
MAKTTAPGAVPSPTKTPVKGSDGASVKAKLTPAQMKEQLQAAKQQKAGKAPTPPTQPPEPAAKGPRGPQGPKGTGKPSRLIKAQPEPDPEEQETETPKSKRLRKDSQGLSKNMRETLQALKDGKPKTHGQIAEITGREKGNLLRELSKLGYVETQTQEGARGHLFTITPEGKEALKA